MRHRHLDRVGVLARILNTLSSNGHNVEQMENQLFSGGRAAVATINVDRRLADDTLAALRALDDVIAVTVTVEGEG